MKNSDIQKELDELSPLLGKLKIPEEKIDSAPYLYFDKLGDDVWKKLAAEKAAKSPSFLTNLREWASGAFAPNWGYALATFWGILMITIISLKFLPNDSTNSPSYWNSQLAMLSDEEVANYVIKNIDDFDREDFINNADLAIDSTSILDYVELSNDELSKIIDEL